MKSWVAAGIFRAGLLVLLEAGEDLVFPLGDVELVEPADHLDVLADVLRQDFDGSVEHGVVCEEVGRMSSSVKSPSRSNMNGMARFQWRQ